MDSALLVGNGFTSNLVENYSNPNMMHCLHEEARDVILHANKLFNPFRKKVACKSEILLDISLTNHIKNVLKNTFEDNIDCLFQKYFITYGLIYETQYEEISSVETLLKIICLFDSQFSNEVSSKVRKIANLVYFNKGNNGLSALSAEMRQPICNWLSQYSWIFTTNFDCILDDACHEKDKIMHLHGGFYIKDRYHKSPQKLPPENAYLVWGVSGDEKQLQTKGGPLKTRDGALFKTKEGALFVVKSLLETYIDALKSKLIEQIDIFGYSGENDQHINIAISENKNIKSVRYFCDPKYVNSDKKLHEIKKLFCLSENIVLTLVSWDNVWNILGKSK